MYLFTGLQRAELRPLVDVDQRLILDMHNHIRLAVAVYITELSRHRRQVLPISKQRWAAVDTRMRRISTRHLNDHHVAIQINKNKMRWVSGTVVVTYDRVNLESP